VKPKQNRSWTDKEKIRVYTLRQDHAAKEIAKLFHTNITQVYNITRLVKKSYEGRCYHCGNPLTQKEKNASTTLVKTCKKCKRALVEYKRGLRNKALKRGQCGYCHRRRVVEGKKACKKCLSATHRRREQIGLCGSCGEHPIAHEGGALCEKCLKRDRVKTSLYRKGKKAKNDAS
jgi:hypothetical protein